MMAQARGAGGASASALPPSFRSTLRVKDCAQYMETTVSLRVTTPAGSI
jgi:hypothetical protein